MVEVNQNQGGVRGLKIGCDIDGVLADFTSGYLRKLHEVSGRHSELKPGEQPKCWNWPTEYGHTKAEDSAAWRSIKKDEQFWLTLPPTMEAAIAINTLNSIYQNGYEVYFITNRPGVAAHAQTVLWLMNQGVGMPMVLNSEDKGAIAKGLKLTHFIDDKWENCLEVAQESQKTRVFCLNTKYNQIPFSEGQENITRINTVKEFFTTLAFEDVNALA